ncbi:MAG TPA: hypothetical protein VKU35_05835 [Candidatus Limnocylindria bacterium]|nr:hypothetical protein [Candidatus Limnocylindria bacterium]
MNTLLLAESEDTIVLSVRRLRLRDRLSARFQTWRLDGLLARGASPDSTPALSLRARTLVGQRTRVEVARALRRVQRDARRGHGPLDPTIPICRARVLECQEQVDELVERLTQPGPVQARGVALARLLVVDGSGPLYARPGVSLERTIEAAIQALALRAD